MIELTFDDAEWRDIYTLETCPDCVERIIQGEIPFPASAAPAETQPRLRECFERCGPLHVRPSYPLVIEHPEPEQWVVADHYGTRKRRATPAAGQRPAGRSSTSWPTSGGIGRSSRRRPSG